MKLLNHLGKDVLPLIKRKKHYGVHMMIFRVFHFSIIVEGFFFKKSICCLVYLINRLS